MSTNVRFKVFLILLGILIIFALTGGQAILANSFSDTYHHWAGEYIDTAVTDGWIKGYTDGKFRPNGLVTRAEFATMVISALKLRDVYIYPLTFSDTFNHWVANEYFIERGIWAEVIVPSDYTDKKFKPDQYITRQEAAIMMVRGISLSEKAESEQGIKTSFIDDSRYPAWVKGFIYEANLNGIIKGYPDGAFRGERQITRAEAVIMVSKMLEANLRKQPAPVKVSIDGQKSELNLEIINRNGQVFLTSKIIDAIKAWNRIQPDVQGFYFSKGASSVMLNIGSTTAFVLDYDREKEITLPAAPFKGKLGEVMIPIEVLNIFGTAVWDESAKALTITTDFTPYVSGK